MRRSQVRFAVRSGLTVMAMLALYFVIPVPGDRGAGIGVTVLVALLGLGTLTYAFLTLAERARRSSDDNAVRLEALVAVLYAFIVFTSLIYLSLASHLGQFTGLNNRIDALYFTMSTIATVGFGDVHATGEVSRAVVTAQIAVDLIIVGLVARIILPNVVSGRQRLRVPDEARAATEDEAQDDDQSDASTTA